MQLFEFTGISTDNEVIALTPGVEIRIIIKLFAEDPENVPDSLDIFLLTAGGDGGSGFDGYTELYQFPGIQQTYESGTITLLFMPQAGQSLGIRLNSGFTDENSFWRYTVQLGGFDSAPLTFVPVTPDAVSFDDPQDPNYGFTSDRVHILHEGATKGISVASGMIIHDGLRQLSLPSGAIEHYDSATDTLKPLFTLFTDSSNLGPELSFDHVYLAGDFTTAHALEFMGQEVFENDFMLDERGPVFGFLAEAPEEFGSFLFGSSAANAGEPVLTIDHEVIGDTRWKVTAQDVVFFYDRIVADILAGDMTVDVDTNAWSLTGKFRIKSLIDDADPLTVVTAPGSLGFFNNPNEGGNDGELFSSQGTTVHMRPVLGGAAFNLGLADISLRLENSQPFSARVGDLKIPFDLSGRYYVNPNFLETTASTVGGDNAIKLDGFSVRGVALEDELVEYETPLVGAVLDDFSASVAGLTAGDDSPATFAAYFKFDWRSGLGGETLLSAQMATQLTSAGLEGGVVVGMGPNNALFQGAGHGVLSPYSSGFFAQVSGTFHLPYLGDVVVAQLGLNQRFGMFGKLTGEADASVILPVDLRSLFALTGPLDTDLDLFVGTTAYRSAVDITAHINSGGYDGEFGLRFRFDGSMQFLGGLILDPDAPAAAFTAAPEDAHAFTLAEATTLLLMRAQGTLDIADIVVIAPDGTAYAGAQLAQRQITLAKDEAGITARVSHAEPGVWKLVAPGATDAIAFADTPDVTVTLSRVTTVEGDTLRLIITGPDQDYDLAVLAGAEGHAPVVQYELTGLRPGVHDIAVGHLGLAEGEWQITGRVSGEGQVTAEDELDAGVTVAGSPDLAVIADLVLTPGGDDEEEGSPGLLLIHVENLGDAPAYQIALAGANGAISTTLAVMTPGQSFILTLDLDALGFDPAQPFDVTVSLSHASYDSAAGNNTAMVAYEPGVAPQTRLWSVDEDGLASEYLADAVTVITAPEHGAFSFGDDGFGGQGWVYTPEPDYSGADLAVVELDGVATRLWFNIAAINDAPTGAPEGDLADGLEDQPYTVLAEDLLQGFTDIDDTVLSITDLVASNGTVVDNLNGSYTITPEADYNGAMSLIYTVSDGRGGTVETSRYYTVNPVGDTFVGTANADSLGSSDRGDTLVGGLGDDTYFIHYQDDTVVELRNEGRDTIMSWASYTLAALNRHVENLTLTGTDHLNATGNNLANVLTGNSGNNTLDGGMGADTLIGGLGNDSYYVQNITDVVTEHKNEGTDTVFASVSYSLVALDRFVENLTLTGSAHLNATGNNLANTLTGNSGDNTINGGAGKDALFGGLGADLFVFDLGSGRDSIRDFSAGQNDRIDISAYTSGIETLSMISQIGPHTVITLSDGNVINVLNTSPVDVLLHIIW